MNETISIIIPTFNRAYSLPEAIHSVLNQSAGNWELIIVDDGSTDKTQLVIEEYLKDKRIRYFFQENSGVSAARNKGIAESNADYIIFLDSDDLLFSDLISTLNNTELKNFDLIFWQVEKIFPDHLEIWKAKKLEKIYNQITATFLAGSVCYKKSMLVRVGGFDENLEFGENYELGMRIAQIPDLRLCYLDQVFLKYEVKPVRENSLPEKKIKSLNYLLEKQQEIYQKDCFSHSRLCYQIGYYSEKLNDIQSAHNFYREARLIDPYYWKAWLKNILMMLK